MTNNLQQNNTAAKSAYTKPTLIEYGSLAERTKMFGLPNPTPDLATVTLGLTALSVT